MPAKKAPAAKKAAPRSAVLATTTQEPRLPGVAPEPVEGAVVIYDLPTVAEVRDAIKHRTKLFYDGETDSESILAQTLGKASTPDALFAESELGKVEDHLGETLTITELAGVRNSSFEGGLGVYLIAVAITQDGEELRLAVGQSDPVGKLIALHEMGALPFAVAFERSERPTRSGFYPINLLDRQPF